MFRLYSAEKTAAILDGLSPLVSRISSDYGIPSACVKAILYREIREIDVLDLAADAAVRHGWFGRTDCSTGYAQIFARVAIRALDFAEDRGLESAARLGVERPLSEKNPADVRRIWLRLNEESEFNLRMGTLNLLSAAEETVGTRDFAGMTPEQMKRAFSRYNSSSGAVTSYGEEAYGFYLRFCKTDA